MSLYRALNRANQVYRKRQKMYSDKESGFDSEEGAYKMGKSQYQQANTLTLPTPSR